MTVKGKSTKMYSTYGKDKGVKDDDDDKDNSDKFFKFGSEIRNRQLSHMPTSLMRLDVCPPESPILTLTLLLLSTLVGVAYPDVDDSCSTSLLLLPTPLATTSPQHSNQPAQTPPPSVQVGLQTSRPLLLMGFTLGSLAVISGLRPLELSSLSRFSALFELRSMFLSVVVFFVLVILGMYSSFFMISVQIKILGSVY